ncbi:hypothetical protein BB934_36490 (plasmid) [Microvirga ossetica]|uniref:Uncharacterized protein n=1 Tax=Microvirga ossetica TaxID=1882682 RepID=A0A1B2EUT8_9HYPH|nr:hypothetical protein [Microvirga ossetica]ANY83736.1 hypothetical protein BB934_36490 [Microvirga ossetica]
MFKIEGSSLDPSAGTSTHAANQHEDLKSLCFDTSALKRRITNQIILIQELSWEAQDTTSAKEALRTMQEALEGWCAHRDLILKLHASGKTG